MSDIAIRCNNLGKQYIIGQRESYRALRDTISDAFTYPARRLRSLFQPKSETAPESSDFWALKDVNFEVKHGEVVGIIGRNGAGKSTLLKILSRITKPTTGEVQINGRVGSLLEVGTGFHPELTGRENVYLNGAILGMKRADITRKFDEIVAFAEIEKFLDTPVKRYSSGMYVRLAFAVAAYMDTEILVIDEVLAVGDLQFQKKCLGKMDEVARSGRTIFFVSHNMGAVKSLCRKVIWLEHGKVKAVGNCAEIVSNYLTLATEGQAEEVLAPQQHIQGSGEVRIEKMILLNSRGEKQQAHLIGEGFQTELFYKVNQPIEGTFWLLVSTLDGTVILSSFQKDNQMPVSLNSDGVVIVEVKDVNFLPGSYLVSAGIFSKNLEMIDWVDSATKFEILPHFNNGQAFDYRYGVITKQLAWRLG